MAKRKITHSPQKDTAVSLTVMENTAEKTAIVLPHYRTLNSTDPVQEYRETKPQEIDYSVYPHAIWGNNDDMPLFIDRRLRSVPVAIRAIQSLADLLHGEGLRYTTAENAAKGIFIPQYNEQVEKLMIDSDWKTQFADDCFNFTLLCNLFHQNDLSLDRKKIINMWSLDPAFCRVGKRSPTAPYLSEKIYFSNSFSDESYTTYTKPEDFIQFALYQPRRREAFFKKLEQQRKYSFVTHTRPQTLGMLYYATPIWANLLNKDSWLDVAATVPKIVSAIQNNQITLKYKIDIPTSYFEHRYHDWMVAKEKQESRIMQVVALLKQDLTGSTNYYATIVNTFVEDKVTGNARGKIEIIPLNDPNRNSSVVWMPDAQASALQIMQILGLHPAVAGLESTSSQLGQQGGSSQREGYNAGITMNTARQNLICKPYNDVLRFNNLPFVFYAENKSHLVLSESKTGLPKPNESNPNAQNNPQKS